MRRAFTLMEMLVVMAVTAILMVILLVPLSRSIDLAQRGTAKVAGQDNARAALRRVTRDLANAMQVFPQRDLEIWGYNAWGFSGQRPRPVRGAAPERYLLRNGLVLFRLPKHRYFCTLGDHTVTPVDIAAVYGAGADYDMFALDTCPRHPASPVELRPLTPLEPSERVTAYLVGLKNPGLGDVTAGQDPPYYENLLLFNGQTYLPGNPSPNTLNTYVLYRIEFDPRGRRDPQNDTDADADGLDDRFVTLIDPRRYDPGFFYDDTPVAVTLNGNRVTQPRYQWWKDHSVQVMNAETADVVRWLQTGDRAVPHSLCTFGPSPVEDETLQPNRRVGQYQLGSGTILPADLPPLEYEGDHGNWLLDPGLASIGLGDGRTLIPDNLAMAGTASLQGPRIQVIGLTSPKAGGAPRQEVVFDSADPAVDRKRLVAFDILTGRVTLAIPRARNVANPLLQEHYQAQLVAGGPYSFTLADDKELINSMPSSFGAAKDRQQAFEARSSNREDFTLVVPGSDAVQLVDGFTSPIRSEPLRRAGWTGLGASLDRPVAQGDLALDEYTIDYRTGEIVLSDRPEAVSRWNEVAAGRLHLLVRYKFQTNRANDVVRASYGTRELAQVNLGVVQYTRRRQELLPFELTERVVVRNLRK